MKLKEFASNINELIANNPECAEYDVISACDDEGNGFNCLHYTPTIGEFDNEYNGEFTSLEAAEEEGEEVTPNAVCVN